MSCFTSSKKHNQLQNQTTDSDQLDESAPSILEDIQQIKDINLKIFQMVIDLLKDSPNGSSEDKNQNGSMQICNKMRSDHEVEFREVRNLLLDFERSKNILKNNRTAGNFLIFIKKSQYIQDEFDRLFRQFWARLWPKWC